VLCLCGIESISLSPAKSFLILNFYRHENVRRTRIIIIIIITIISGSVHCCTIIYQMGTKHTYCCTVHIIHKTRSRLQSSLYSIDVYKYFAMCARGSKEYKPLYLTAIFCHQTFDLWSSHINNIIWNIYIYIHPTKTKMSTSTAALAMLKCVQIKCHRGKRAAYISNYHCVIFETKLDLQIKYHSKFQRLI